jgi:hypothetical protein
MAGRDEGRITPLSRLSAPVYQLRQAIDPARELTADRLSLPILEAAGYDPQAALDIAQRSACEGPDLRRRTDELAMLLRDVPRGGALDLDRRAFDAARRQVLAALDRCLASATAAHCMHDLQHSAAMVVRHLFAVHCIRHHELCVGSMARLASVTPVLHPTAERSTSKTRSTIRMRVPRPREMALVEAVKKAG